MRAADGAGTGQSRMALTSTVVSVGIFAMTTACIAHAYYHKQQFYPTVVYLTKSNASLAVGWGDRDWVGFGSSGTLRASARVRHDRCARAQERLLRAVACRRDRGARS